MKNKLLLAFVICLLIPLKSSAFDVGQAIGSAIGGATMLADAAKSITPSEEHYIGRAVAANVLTRYPLLNNPSLTKYVNQVGLSVANVSNRPSTYGGYHFAVLNSNEPNAYACPGGIILINKGLLKELKNEDQLAAVLAHEVAHVADSDGIKEIKKSRWTNLAFYAAGEVGKNVSSQNVAEAVKTFDGVVGDVTKKVIDSGYSKGDEKQADAAGMRYMASAGYNPSEMIEFLKIEESKGNVSSGPFSSHPKPSQRIKALEGELARLDKNAKTEQARSNRFKWMTASVK